MKIAIKLKPIRENNPTKKCPLNFILVTPYHWFTFELSVIKKDHTNDQTNYGTHSKFTFSPDRSFKLFYYFFGNGKTKPTSAIFTVTSFIYTIKSIENTR